MPAPSPSGSGRRTRSSRSTPEPELLERLADAFDEPFGDEAALPTLLVCEATRRHVTVALVGDGGDEAFGGYERYRAHELAGRVPGSPRRPAALPSVLCPRPAASRARRSSAPAVSWTRPHNPQPSDTPGSSRCSRSELPPGALDGRGARPRRRRDAPARPRPAARRHRVVPPGRPAPEGGHRLDGGLARAAGAVPRPPRGRARPRPAAGARPWEGGAEAGVRRRPPARDDRARGKTGFGVPLDHWFRERAPADGRGPPARRRDRGLFRRETLERLLREHPTGGPTTATGCGACAPSSSGSAASSTRPKPGRRSAAARLSASVWSEPLSCRHLPRMRADSS